MEETGLVDVLKRFPEVNFACAYGSGVFPQRGQSDNQRPMIDFIFGVDNPKEWHKENMKVNGRDYSGLARTFGAMIFPGAQTYYNAFVKLGDREIKYGVLESQKLVEDLLYWEPFYVAGRMQKPVKILKSEERFDAAQRINLDSAVNVVLLMLPESFSKERFYSKISSLSYIGDSRVGIAEDPFKVANIVAVNKERFDEMFISHLLSNGAQVDGRTITQEKSEVDEEKRIYLLPRGLYESVVMRRVLASPGTWIGQIIEDELKRKNRSVSIAQTLQGTYSTGPWNSARYLREKLRKAWRRKK